ncbi:MAG TPA: imidazoleglycerol-phosphate dehydratase HisB [Brevundimonas sp.]|nr:imidazoleglycerol-phosphate dehydratase HisB [Brevundimonas sp.]
MSLPAPFAPLVAAGDGLECYPAEPRALAARMAEVYGVQPEQVLPIRGVTHGLELVFRLAARDGQTVEAPETEPCRSLRTLYAQASVGASLAAVILAAADGTAQAEAAMRVSPALLFVDEGVVEFSDHGSSVSLIADHANLVVLRSLSLAYGLAGVRIGAALGQPEALARLASVMEPWALPESSVRLALQALDPSRMMETRQRVDAVRRERQRLVGALGALMPVEAAAGPTLLVRPAEPQAARKALTAVGVAAEPMSGGLRLPLSAKAEINDRLLAAFGLEGGSRPHRIGQSVRDTRETRIVCAVDLDAAAPVSIATGVGFFDHMLEQVATHGGFSLRLACEGDLHTDPHHTIEDSAIALGQALKQALGDRKGIARYGFVVPMDEANAAVSIDLSGRPYPVFEGTFSTPMIGDYRTDLTAHVFRSLAEAMGAAVHVSVTGDDDHHKTEAVYKAFGRALRQAIRIEGDAVPSTKGVL